jgi:cytoskeleton protein RodZ
LTEATGVGARLRQAREEQGLAIDDVALQLKFAPRQIEFLEQERFDRLPGPTIARGMVRNYARLLKLDPEPLIQRMAPQAEPPPDPGLIAERFRQQMPFSDSGRRSTLIYAGFSVALLILVGVLAYEWQQQKATPQFVAPARERPQAEPAQTASVVQAPAPAPEPASAVPAVEPKPPAPVVAEQKKSAPAVTEQKKPGASVAEQKKPAPAVAEKKPEAEKLASADNTLPPGQHRIVFRSEGEAWLEVKDGSGRMLISALNPAGAERSVRGQPPFEIVIGNASSVRMTYDGKPVDLRPHTRVEVARFTLK